MNKIIEKIAESYDEYWAATEGMMHVCKDDKQSFVVCVRNLGDF